MESDTMSLHDDTRLALERPISRRSVLRAGLGLAAAAAGVGALGAMSCRQSVTPAS